MFRSVIRSTFLLIADSLVQSVQPLQLHGVTVFVSWALGRYNTKKDHTQITLINAQTNNNMGQDWGKKAKRYTCRVHALTPALERNVN